MKIKLLSLFIFISTFSSQLFSQSAGFNNTFIVLSINGSLNLYYDLNAATDNYDFDGQSLGTFCEGSTDLIFKGGEHNVYCPGLVRATILLRYTLMRLLPAAGVLPMQVMGEQIIRQLLL